MDDLEYPQIQARLSTPADAIPGQVGRRAFLGGAIAAGGAIALLPSWMGDMAAAATPIGPEDGVLVLLQLGGGNDGLSTVAPMPGHADHSRYQSFRGSLAVSGALPLADGLGFNPGLHEAQEPVGRRQGRRRPRRGPDRQRPQPLHLDRHLDGRHLRQRPRLGLDRALARRRARSRPPACAASRSGRRCRSTCGAGPPRSPRSRPAAT